MDDRRRLFKKIFIAAVYLAVFAGLGTGGYFLFRTAPVPPVTAPTIYPIEIVWSQAFTVGPDLYSIAAKIKNPNTGFGASNFSYTLYSYDANGVLLNASAGNSFIWPGEYKFIILGGVNLSKKPSKVQLQLGEPEWREVKNFKGIDLTLENINYVKGKTGSGKFYSIDSTASNNTPYDLGKVYVSAVVLDQDEFPIAVASTLLENLKSKEHRLFSIPWFSPFAGVPSNIILDISTNLWDTPSLIGQ